MAEYAASIMSKSVISVAPETPVPQIAALLAARGVSAVPVVDAEQKLVGMVSEGDLMAPFTAQHQAKRAWWLDMLAEGEKLAPEFEAYVNEDKRKAKDVMTKQVVTATEGSTIAEVAELLIKHHIKRVPIMREGRVVGIVSRADLTRALAGQAG